MCQIVVFLIKYIVFLIFLLVSTSSHFLVLSNRQAEIMKTDAENARGMGREKTDVTDVTDVIFSLNIINFATFPLSQSLARSNVYCTVIIFKGLIYDPLSEFYSTCVHP